ncbi:MAG: transposase zinc-binding domain-containing protein [Burkholderiales bacterium]|nr:transposase zinc-binding domain-containing protein [Burkholderiales bacterium]
MAISLAEVLQHFGPEYLSAHRLSSAQARAWRAIVSCRTPALGGQLMRCDRCGAQQWRWHSCLMESVPIRGVRASRRHRVPGRRAWLNAGSSPFPLTTWVRSWSRSWLNPHQEISMLDSYFCAPKTLGRLRAGQVLRISTASRIRSDAMATLPRARFAT